MIPYNNNKCTLNTSKSFSSIFDQIAITIKKLLEVKFVSVTSTFNSSNKLLEKSIK